MAKKNMKKEEQEQRELYELYQSALAMIAEDETTTQTNKVFGLIQAEDIEGISNLEPVNGMAVVSAVAQANEQDQKIARRLLAKYAASHPRPKRQHKSRKVVDEYLKEWKKHPSLYPSQAAFIKDMQEKTDINRPETIRKWIKETKR